jgi:hypothetical protein
MEGEMGGDMMFGLLWLLVVGKMIGFWKYGARGLAGIYALVVIGLPIEWLFLSVYPP